MIWAFCFLPHYLTARQCKMYQDSATIIIPPQKEFNMRQFKLIQTVALLAGLLAQFPASAQPQLSGTPDELRGFLFPRPNTINISGDADLTAYKDVAKVSLLITTEARDLNQAMADNQQLRAEIIEQFIAAGIPADDINNSKFSSSPQYGLFGRNPNAFEVNARLDVSVSSESHLQLVAAAADNDNDVEFESIAFEHSEEDEFERQVRDLALEDVMEQKSYYESTLDLQLQAINFYYGGIQQFARAMPMAMAEEAVSVDAVRSSAAAGLQASAAAVTPSFDEVEYRTSVTVVFEIVSDSGN